MLFEKRSSLTGQMNTMELPITLQQVQDWQNSGQHVQDAFPRLSVDQREFLLTGSTPEEWDRVFGKEEA